MKQKYEYKFEVLNQGFFSLKNNTYEAVVQDHARDGWRLVQILDTSRLRRGRAWCTEIVFERELEDR